MSKVIGRVGGEEAAGAVLADRRTGCDRRRFTWCTVVQGALGPRRRVARRAGDVALILDWQQPHLVLMALGVLLLSVTDALLTLTLLAHGATEVNPLLAYLINHHPQWFGVLKMALTGGGVIVLVVLARAKVFRVIRASSILRWVLIGYLAVIVYELWLLGKIP